MNVVVSHNRIPACIVEGLIRYLVSKGIQRDLAGCATTTIFLDSNGRGEFTCDVPEN